MAPVEAGPLPTPAPSPWPAAEAEARWPEADGIEQLLRGIHRTDLSPVIRIAIQQSQLKIENPVIEFPPVRRGLGQSAAEGGGKRGLLHPGAGADPSSDRIEEGLRHGSSSISIHSGNARRRC